MSTIKNLWNNRRATAWIFLELTLVTIVSWVILDPAIVGIADRRLPLGYDADRLVVVDIASLPEDAPGYDTIAAKPERLRDDAFLLRDILRNLPQVESATLTSQLIGDDNITTQTYRSMNLAVDTVAKPVVMVQCQPDVDFFSTYGFRAAEGYPSIKELDSHPRQNEVIVTRAMAERYWPGENALNKRFLQYVTPEGDSLFYTVAGVIEGVRHWPANRSESMSFMNFDFVTFTTFFGEAKLVARVRPGEDPRDLADELRNKYRPEFSVGNFYLRNAQTYTSMLDHTMDSRGDNNTLRLACILAGFFLANLILGVIGTFWLQTRKRVAEMGIRRTFGAPRTAIAGMLLAENLLLATVAALLGCFLYWQYALRHGLSNGSDFNNVVELIPNWVTSFPEHFAIVSLIVYLLIIICVTVGTLIPAISVSRVPIVDSLRTKE